MWHSTYSGAEKAEPRKGLSCLYASQFNSREPIRLLFLARDKSAKLAQQSEFSQRSQERHEQRKLRRVSVALKNQTAAVSMPRYDTTHDAYRPSETT